MLIDLTDDQRQLLIIFATRQWVAIKDDPEFATEADECEQLLVALRRPVTTVPLSD